MIKQAINQERRKELTLYKNYASDNDFQKAIENSMISILENIIDSSELDSDELAG